jgi:hypothetical protein
MQKSLVGFTYGQALTDLHERLEMYMPPDADVTGLIIDYITAKNLDDVRNDPATAAGFLSWCESPLVRWQEGWVEAFVHCAGMHSRLVNLPEFRDVSPITRQLIDRASLDLQVRVRDVEDRLATFNFGDMWPMTSAIQPAAKGSFERFQRWLIRFYNDVYISWPPPMPQEGESWLTRDLAMRLQRDFGALYDYVVNRDIVWDESEERSTRKWNLVSRSGKEYFRADSDDLPITDIFVAFDNRHRFPHIPHPFPLLPDSHPITLQSKSTSLLKKRQKTPEDRAAERRAALAYSNATNINILGSGFVSNELVEAFVTFEKSDRPGECDPYDARRGRWILLYGLLQVLATISVDTPSVRWTDDVQYFINPRLRGVPPWQTTGDPPVEEASHQRSYCWQVPLKWDRSNFSSQDDIRGGTIRENRSDPRLELQQQREEDSNNNSSNNSFNNNNNKPDRLDPRLATSAAQLQAAQQRERPPYNGLVIQRQITLHQSSETQSEISGGLGNGLLAGSESDDVATTTSSQIGGQRAKDWVNSGGGYKGLDAADTVAIRSEREKVREWPIQSVRPHQQTREQRHNGNGNGNNGNVGINGRGLEIRGGPPPVGGNNNSFPRAAEQERGAAGSGSDYQAPSDW